MTSWCRRPLAAGHPATVSRGWVFRRVSVPHHSWLSNQRVHGTTLQLSALSLIYVYICICPYILFGFSGQGPAVHGRHLRVRASQIWNRTPPDGGMSECKHRLGLCIMCCQAYKVSGPLANLADAVAVVTGARDPRGDIACHVSL